MRFVKTAAFAVLALLALASRADAVPPIGNWVEISGTIYPAGSPETSAFSETTGAGVTTFTVSFMCTSAPTCTGSTTSIIEPVPGVFVAGPFDLPTPKHYFFFMHHAQCTTQFGATSYLGFWSDTGSPPLISACYLPRQIHYIPRNIRPQTMPPLNLPQIHLPPVIHRPGLIGPGPAPGPIPPH